MLPEAVSNFCTLLATLLHSEETAAPATSQLKMLHWQLWSLRAADFKPYTRGKADYFCSWCQVGRDDLIQSLYFTYENLALLTL